MFFRIALTSFVLFSLAAVEQSSLFKDLELVEKIDQEHQDALPFFQNSSMMGGYFSMPSARMPKEGVAGVGFARVHPYNNYGVSFQYFDRIELSLNYRVYTGITEANFGRHGFGDDAERIANAKFVFNLPSDGLGPYFPQFAIGIEDFIGTKRFNSQYIVATQIWKKANIEATIGWGKKRLKGFFGGIAWSPWRKTDLFFLNKLSLSAEYDGYDYKNHPHEHPLGRTVSSRINAGVSYVLDDMLQLTVNSHRGESIAAMGVLRYPLGTTKGFIPKTHNPLLYRSPIDMEPLGVIRPDADFINELGYSLGQQGLDLYRAYMTKDEELWIKIINNMYREEPIVRERIQRVLAAITPSNVKKVTVMVEADGVVCQGYHFRTEDLYRYREGSITRFEMAALSPMTSGQYRPAGAHPLYKRKKEVWLITFRPRVQTFFGSSTGKIKYNLSLVASPEGYLFDNIYYEAQVGYSIRSSMQRLGDFDRLNPSQLPNVRTDSVRYFQTNTLSLEKGYLQKSWHIGRGWFYRVAGGYFEPAYGGGATELLYYAATADWAVGIEGATVWKRRYRGLGFTDKIRILKGFQATHEHFLGVQYFFNLYYTWKPWNLDCKITAGQFLARDRGVKFEINRWFQSGLQVSLWYTITNGHDHVNHHIYYDKGFAFYLPLDFFLTRSSRTYIGYAVSAWLRDIGAIADSGKSLYSTIRLERMSLK